MTTEFCHIHAAVRYAVPLAKALSSGFLRATPPDPAPSNHWLLPSPSVPDQHHSEPGAQPRWTTPLHSRLTLEDHVARISLLHPDDRLVYLSTVGYSDANVATAAQIVGQWLDHISPSLHTATQQAFESGQDLRWAMDTWGDTGPYPAFIAMVQSSPITHTEPVAAYAACSATELAQSILMLRQLDSQPAPVLGGADRQWAVEDARIASLGLADEVAQWPQ